MAEAAVTDANRPMYRPFTLGDAMILIIALALGLAIARPAIALIVDAVRSDPRWRFQTFARAVALGRMLNIIMLNFLLFMIRLPF
jgi:hypothetical protein